MELSVYCVLPYVSFVLKVFMRCLEYIQSIDLLTEVSVESFVMLCISYHTRFTMQHCYIGQLP